MSESGELAGVLGDRYQVEARLGAGMFGEVYKARDTLLQRVVAVKSIRLGNFSDPANLEEVRKRFLREAQVAAKLKHPNIVTVYDVVSSGDTSFIIMEFVEGETLQAMLARRKRLPLPEAVQIIAQAAGALDHAHQHRVVHRDVKPANIMIERDGSAKVTDFGVAKMDAGSNLTATGSIVGTPNYMSPEQARGEPVDGRADLYSLGCILYESLSGERPFRGDSLPSLLLKILTAETPELDCPALGLPSEIRPILRRALAKNPAERFPSGAALSAALREVLGRPAEIPTIRSAPPPLPPPVPAVPATPPPLTVVTPPVLVPAPASRRRSPALWVPAILIALAVGGLWVWRGERPSSPEEPSGAPGLAPRAEPPARRPDGPGRPAVTPAPTPPEPAPPVVSETYEAREGAEFNVDPESAEVAVDGKVIGIADDWDGKGDGRIYYFSGPGTHYARFTAPGYRTAWVKIVVDARADEAVADVDTTLRRESGSSKAGKIERAIRKRWPFR